MSRPETRRRRGPRAAVAALVVLMSACSIKLDGGPRDISDDQKPQTVTIASSVPTESGEQSTIYLLAPQAPGDPSQLRAVGRAEVPSPQEVLTTLFAGPNAIDQSQRLRTAIPPTTTLRRAVEVSNKVLLIDVSDSFSQTNPDLLTDAVAQIVFTACGLPNVSAVQLEVEGVPEAWPRGDGTTTTGPLSPFDYPERNPSSQPDFPAVPSPTPITTTAGSRAPASTNPTRATLG